MRRGIISYGMAAHCKLNNIFKQKKYLHFLKIFGIIIIENEK